MITDDRELTRPDIQTLTGRDAIVSFFAGLGYRTDARVSQTCAAMGITAESLQRQIRHIERVGGKEGGAEPLELSGEFSKQPSLRRRLIGVSPSTIEGREVQADLLFTHVTRDSMELGQAIHELFEKISWIDETDIEQLIQEWQESTRASEETPRRAIEQFRRATASGEVRQALSRPGGDVTLWREKHFEIVLDDQWITGVFDRVTITHGPDGRPLQATILDFKSNEITDDAELANTAEQYRPQLLLYGKALARMLQINPSQVSLRLLLTGPGRVYGL